jgi:hypothetical protein
VNDEDYLERLLPHRLDALAILVLMLELRLKWEEPKPMQVFVEGKLQFEGQTNLLTNPIVEAGILHVRALLEFLGLKSASGALVSVAPGQRRIDDATIELLSLPPVTPSEARSIYPEDPALSEASLAAAISAANKGMAHLSVQYPETPLEAKHLLLAARLTQQLVEKYVYLPLGRHRPALPIEARSRA